MTRDYCILRQLEPGCVLRDVEVMDRVLRVNGLKGTAPALARRMHPGGVRVVGRMSPEALEFSDPSSPLQKLGGNTTIFVCFFELVYDCTTKSPLLCHGDPFHCWVMFSQMFSHTCPTTLAAEWSCLRRSHTILTESPPMAPG